MSAGARSSLAYFAIALAAVLPCFGTALPALAGTARPALARISATTAANHGLGDGQPVTVTSAQGSITLPVAVTEMVDGVVWVPGNSIGSTVNVTLRVGPGAVVALSAGGAQ